jgi:hypothetical protein
MGQSSAQCVGWNQSYDIFYKVVFYSYFKFGMAVTSEIFQIHF